LKPFFLIFTVSISFSLSCQIFEGGVSQKLTKKGADHVYNANIDSVILYADSLATLLPEHPIAPLMKAMGLLWANIPLISDSIFREMESHLDSTVILAKKIDPDLEDPEMIFLSMAAHGLLAEYYADKDYTMKAVGEASRAYSLLKKGFDLVDQHPQFLVTTGLYNYFREKYPEKHPVYRPLMWLFRGGNKELGLDQLEMAIDSTYLTRVEAHVYLSYIYLRYVYKPQKAQEYLSRLCLLYPNNFYAKAKYLESLANERDFQLAPLEMIHELTHNPSSYYKLAGYVFQGYYEEVVNKDLNRAQIAYRAGLGFGADLPDHGEFFKGFGYLGLGRVLLSLGNAEDAEMQLRLALKYPETEHIEEEANALLSQI